MFSMLPPTPAYSASYNFKSNQSYKYTPVVSSPLSSRPLRSSPTSSPLSPCDVNVPPRVFSCDFDYNSDDKMMTSPTPSPSKSKPKQPQFQSQSRSQSQPQSPTITLPSPPPSRGKEHRSMFGKRPTKPNPLFHGRKDGEDGRETRRKLFLKKVREGAEEKRWRDRGGDEEIMRVLWFGEERERRRREEVAMQMADQPIPEEEELNLDEMMAEEVAMNEEAELEAMFEDMQRQPETPYGSDDEEYDDIFMDVINEETRTASLEQQQRPPKNEYLQLENQDEEMMDMS